VGTSVSGDNSAHTVVAVQVPAGNYWVSAKLFVFQDSSESPITVTCDIAANGANIDETNRTVGSTGNLPYVLAGPLITTGSTTITLSCAAPSDVSAAIAKLDAIQAQNVTQSPPPPPPAQPGRTYPARRCCGAVSHCRSDRWAECFA
jgi:hypothetical protein